MNADFNQNLVEDTNMEITNLSRRAFIAMALSTTTGVAGCFKSKPPRLLIGLLDVSGSVTEIDFAGYLTSLNSLVGSMHAAQTPSRCDRLIVAPIDDQPMSKFRPLLERTILASGLKADATELPQKRRDIQQEIGAISPRKNVVSTCIFDALGACGEVVANHPKHKPLLLIASDMLEDSPYASFSKVQPANDQIAPFLEKLANSGLLPKLNGAEVHVTGGSGANAETYSRTKAFWTAYFAKAGATLVRYSRAPLEF